MKPRLLLPNNSINFNSHEDGPKRDERQRSFGIISRNGNGFYWMLLLPLSYENELITVLHALKALTLHILSMC